MNTVLLKYAIEVEKTGSITRAAGNLNMDQPNLSKAIKTLEESLGAPIFKRTTKGVVPTARGRIYLEYARTALSHLEEMEALYHPLKGNGARMRLSIPRASYISEAFSRFVKRMERGEGMNLWLRETNSADTIDGVQSGDYQLGIIRFQPESERYYMQQLSECGLESRTVVEYGGRLLMSEKHPLSSKAVVTSKDLTPYIEITHGDTAKKTEEEILAQKRIYVFERGSQLGLLHENVDTYMWVSPMPKSLLKLHGLVEKECEDAGRSYRDVLIYRKGYRFSEWDELFLKELETVKCEVASQTAR